MRDKFEGIKFGRRRRPEGVRHGRRTSLGPGEGVPEAARDQINMNAPKKIRLNRAEKNLQLIFDDVEYELPAEYLRVYSPSAEVRGHGASEPVLVSGKLHVGIDSVEAAGRYALKIVFDDGHDTGIYTWEYLRELAENREANWQNYLERLYRAGKGRDPDESAVKFIG